MSIRRWPTDWARSSVWGFLDGPVRWLSEHPWVGWGMLCLSLAMILAAILLLPWIIGRIPAEYFSRNRRPQLPWQQMHPALRIAALAAKNLLGALLILAGIIMLFGPGQGVLTILLGLALVDVPGKRALERWIVARPAVFNALNKLRARGGHPPLEHPYS